MNKIRDGRVFSLVHLTWNDPVSFPVAVKCKSSSCI